MEHVTMNHVAIGFAILSFVGAFVCFVAVGFSCYYSRKRTKLYNQLRQSLDR